MVPTNGILDLNVDLQGRDTDDRQWPSGYFTEVFWKCIMVTSHDLPLVHKKLHHQGWEPISHQSPSSCSPVAVKTNIPAVKQRCTFWPVSPFISLKTLNWKTEYLMMQKVLFQSTMPSLRLCFVCIFHNSLHAALIIKTKAVFGRYISGEKISAWSNKHATIILFSTHPLPELHTLYTCHTHTLENTCSLQETAHSAVFSFSSLFFQSANY